MLILSLNLFSRKRPVLDLLIDFQPLLSSTNNNKKKKALNKALFFYPPAPGTWKPDPRV